LDQQDISAIAAALADLEAKGGQKWRTIDTVAGKSLARGQRGPQRRQLVRGGGHQVDFRV
jgi:hypothetical protein